MARLIEKKLAKLEIGTAIEVTYEHSSENNQVLRGVITDTDGESSIEIRTEQGEEMILDFSLVLAVKVLETMEAKAPAKPATAPAPRELVRQPGASAKPVLLHQQEQTCWFNLGDNAIADLFKTLKVEERKKLNGPYDSFKYGVKMNDNGKVKSAAMGAKKAFFEAYDCGFTWSPEAVQFVGALLRRVSIYDEEVFLTGECFEEAAYAAWHKKAYTLAGAFAILALMQEKPQQIQAMVGILASGVVHGDDVSGLELFRSRMPAGMDWCLKRVVSEAFEVKGIQIAQDQDLTAAIAMLATMYPKQEMAKELEQWLPAESEAGAQPEEPVSMAMEPTRGIITRINWADHTGVITGEDGKTYAFTYHDIETATLKKAVENCMRTDLGGKVYYVAFQVVKTSAKKIRADSSFVDRGRALVVDSKQEDRFEVAFELCKKAMATTDVPRALEDLAKYALNLYKSTGRLSYVEEVAGLYEDHVDAFPTKPAPLLDMAACYSYLKRYPQMLKLAEQALATKEMSARQRIAVLSNYLRMTKEYYDSNGDSKLLIKMLERADESEKILQTYPDFTYDRPTRNQYTNYVLPYRAVAEALLDRQEEAEADYAKMTATGALRQMVEALIQEMRQRNKPEPEEEPVEVAPEQEELEREEEELGEEVIPYEDKEGWPALGLTEDQVMEQVFSMVRPDRMGPVVAYLRVAAGLNPELKAVYGTVALAANDPLESPDYSFVALMDSLARLDMKYPVLNDYCSGAALLRSAFQAGKGYDYGAPGVDSYMTTSETLSSLQDAYDTMLLFRREAGQAIDIYADYRNHGVNQLQEDLAQVLRQAQEVYTKYIATPPRESSSFFRILETKKILFHRDGYLATLLRYVAEDDRQALEDAWQQFATTFLNGAAQITGARISTKAVDQLIADAWDQAGRGMQAQKATATLQGDRRNNLRSNLTEILSTICQWYTLAEQSASLTWRTEQGEGAYEELRPELMQHLQQLQKDCMEAAEQTEDRQAAMGLFLLASTAGELLARLDGSWKFEQERFFYVDFLLSDQVMLGEDFMPELNSTFCAMPEFNLLARIRKHMEEPRVTFQQRIDRIYGMERSCNNYGTAQRILEYLEAMGWEEEVQLPEQAQKFLDQSLMQADMAYGSFRETYALAANYGQIMKSDGFCCQLEEIVRYWYVFCKGSRNFGFLTGLLTQARDQIHTSARSYEVQLGQQLEALMEANQTYFQDHPDYAQSIRDQIANQNFTVAEDWMSRIRVGDFSLDLQQSEALGYLDEFWRNFPATYAKVADTSCALVDLLKRRVVRNKDAKGAQLLIDSWLYNGNASNTTRIGQLLKLLGWTNVRAYSYTFPADTKAEIYEIRTETSTIGLTAPKHPIAAFGSQLERRPMYAVCLYGSYGCERLYEKIRSLDVIDGSKVILLDYALGQMDRRALAQKLKRRDSGLRNTYLVIDRVLITHLANHYNENLINRILMAIGMPFSYYQPYVPDSIHTMPPEIFIGRQDELLKIEQPDGVNLIYGGRQLGKSALLKKAVADLDGRQKKRAILVDINQKDCAAAARLVSEELISLGITPGEEVTDDWDALCSRIKLHLRRQGPELPYFLLMLDEADAFIRDCANFNYYPMAALKNLQMALGGQFKFVIAGLRDIVKFNREVALGNNSVITHMNSLKIMPFRTPDAQELLTGPLSYLGFSLPSKVTVSLILATCNYFPGLIQLYAKKLIESIRESDYAGYEMRRTPPYVVSDEHLRRVMADKEFVAQIWDKFEITLKLDQDQGSYYYPLALMIAWMHNVAPSQSGYTAKEILRNAQDMKVGPLLELNEEKVGALLAELQDLNILRSVSNQSYLMASKNFLDLLGTEEEITGKLEEMGQ